MKQYPNLFHRNSWPIRCISYEREPRREPVFLMKPSAPMSFWIMTWSRKLWVDWMIFLIINAFSFPAEKCDEELAQLMRKSRPVPCAAVSPSLTPRAPGRSTLWDDCRQAGLHTRFPQIGRFSLFPCQGDQAGGQIWGDVDELSTFYRTRANAAICRNMQSRCGPDHCRKLGLMSPTPDDQALTNALSTLVA